MKRYAQFALALTVALASALTAHALPSNRQSTATSRATKQRAVVLVLDNQTVLHRRVQVGDVVYDLAPTMMVKLRVPVGTVVTSRSAMRSFADGKRMLIASPDASGLRVVVD